MREQLEAAWPEGETDATRVEERVRRIEREVFRDLTEEMLREQSRKRSGNRSACASGGTTRYRNDSPLEVVTLFGWMRLTQV